MEGVNSELASIDDVLHCWGSVDNDDDESVDIISKVEDTVEDHMRCGGNDQFLSTGTQPSYSFQESSSILDQLVKKYPKFIPLDLPVSPRKRSRPICMFVNYMGTRQPLAATPKPFSQPIEQKARVPEPTSYPTDAPLSYTRSLKKRRILPKMIPTMIPTDTPVVTPITKKKNKTILEVSPEPTLGPTRKGSRVTPPPSLYC